MVSAVNSSSWNNLAAMNDFKLSQSLSSGKTSTVDAVQPVPKAAAGLSGETTKFLKEYQDSLSNLSRLAQKLSNNQRSSATNAMGVSSKNPSVLGASAKYPVGDTASYTVDVQQLAAAQVNIGDAVQGDAAPTANGSFVLETAHGRYGFELDASQAVDNRDLFEALANEINKLKTGVTAQVVEDGGKVALALSGNGTGEKNAFSVSGDFAVATGIDSVVQESRDAVYSVSKDGGRAQTFTSSENTVTVGGYQIEATLKGVGSAKIEVGADRDAIGSALEDLVNQYNKTIGMLDKNSDRGTGVVRQLRRLIQPPVSIKSMQKVGISIKEDGSYVFDRKTFNNAFDQDPNLVKEIVGGDHGIAQGLQRDAQMGLNAPSASLTNAEKKNGLGGIGASSSSSTGGLLYQNYDRLAIQMMSTYSKSGAYNMINYYTVGALMNLNV